MGYSSSKTSVAYGQNIARSLPWISFPVCNLVLRATCKPRHSFLPPNTSAEAIESAAGALVFTTNQIREELMLGYMNGPRSLKDDNLSCLTVCAQAHSSGDFAEYELMMCAPHFIGDGTSLHQTTNELLEILSTYSTDDDLLQLVENECSGNWVCPISRIIYV